MSTKIYNGYRLSDQDLTLWRINELLSPARQAMQQAAEIELFRTRVSQACHLLDQRVLRLAGYEITPHAGDRVDDGHACLSTAFLAINDNIEEDRKKHRRNFLDPEASLSVFGDASGTYCLLYCESKAGREVFEQTLGCLEYNYWNNADEPDDVSKDEWDDRGRRWNDLLGPSGVPAAQGAAFELVPASLIWSVSPDAQVPETLGVADVESGLPLDLVGDIKQRAYRLALTQPAGQFPEDVHKSSGLSAHMAYLRRLSNGEIPEFNEVRDKIAALLPQTYCLAALRESLEEAAQRFSHLVCPKGLAPAP